MSFLRVGKPTLAFVLSLIAGIIYLIIGLIVIAAATVISSAPSLSRISDVRRVLVVAGGIGLVSGVIMVVGCMWMNSENMARVRTGAILVVIFMIIGALFTDGGFVFGFVLGLIGSILGLVWKPPAQMPSSPASTT
jgi:hypothetical protein